MHYIFKVLFSSQRQNPILTREQLAFFFLETRKDNRSHVVHSSVSLIGQGPSIFVFLYFLHFFSSPMVHVSQLPCDGDGLCMTCKIKPLPDDSLTCKTCATPWHVTCIPFSSRPQTLSDALRWGCPDCSLMDHHPPSIAGSDELVVAIKAIESDDSLTELEKARRRQELVSGGGARSLDDEGGNVENEERINGDNDVLAILDGNINCSICMQLPERPVTVSSRLSINFLFLNRFCFCSLILNLMHV